MAIKMKKFFLICFLFSCFFLFVNYCSASHNRAGEITYTWVSGNTYKFTVTTYTKESSPADRPFIEIDWGDNNSDTLYRVNGPPDPNNNNIPYGMVLQGKDVKYNLYIGTHTFPGPGQYSITFEDANRNADVVNMPDSYDTPLFIKTVLMINPAFAPNNSVQLLYPPLDDACLNQIFIHNPGAYDADGDSISYKLIKCLGTGGDTIPGYQYPDEVSPGPMNTLTIDPVNGDLVWNSPKVIGEYNVAIMIEEWRLETNSGAVLKIGTIIRDMQFTVADCNNGPPEIDNLPDICVEAGDTIGFTVTATDYPYINGNDTFPPDSVTLAASGGPFIVNSSPAIFSSSSTSASSASGDFYWETKCSHIRKQPYQVVFIAEDNNSRIKLVDMESVQISIIGPAPENPEAQPQGNAIVLSWDQSVCNEVVGYRIFRRSGQYQGNIPCPCETGVPGYTGYSLAGQTNGLTETDFIDNNNGSGLILGFEYCYLIVAYFADGGESCASEQVCTMLIKDVPVITHVSVGATGFGDGRDTIIWSMPTELDTDSQYTGPFLYKIYRSDDFTGGSTYIGETTPSYSLKNTDTIFIDSLINTVDNPHSYKVELYNDNNYLGPTNIASSVFLSITPSDNRLELSWQENVPWTNTEYIVYKLNEFTSAFQALDTVSTRAFVDTGLTNAKEYCYFVKSIGTYFSTGLVDPIINFSQQLCAEPVDTTPPCPPVATVSPDCDNMESQLIWSNPNNSCADDVVMYNIYYTPVLGGDFNLIGTVTGADDTTFLFNSSMFPGVYMENSIAGCFAVTALDSSIIYS